MFPSWDSYSLTELETWQGRLQAIGFIGSIVVGLAVAIGGPLISNAKRKLDARISELKSTEAATKEKSRADKLDAQLDEQKQLTKTIAALLAHRSDILTTDRQAQVVERLKKFPKTPVALQIQASNQEAFEFSQTIQDILNKAWQVRSVESHVGVPEGTVVIGGVGRGVEIVYAEESQKDAAQCLFGALGATGLPNVRIKSAKALPKGVSVVVQVGPK